MGNVKVTFYNAKQKIVVTHSTEHELTREVIQDNYEKIIEEKVFPETTADFVQSVVTNSKYSDSMYIHRDIRR